MPYKELDRPYVAKQLNGPVIKAFIKAVYNFFHKDTDDHCDYFGKISIDTADASHLVFIGKLMGVQLFEVFTDPSGNKYLTFAAEDSDAEYEFGYNNGFAENYEQLSSTVKGVFGTGDETDFPVEIPTPKLRQLLSALSQTGTYSADSIFMIDTITSIMTESTDYVISYDSEKSDVVDIVFGNSVTLRTINILQKTFDRVLEGGTVVLLSRQEE